MAITTSKTQTTLNDWLRETHPDIWFAFQREHGEIFVVPALDFDPVRLIVHRNGVPVNDLSRLEFRLFVHLWNLEGGVATKHDLVLALWGDHYLERVDDSRIAKLVSRLRAKVGGEFVLTVHGTGYRLER